MKSGFVALAGRPNAGKSTLLNALLQEKIAIVSAKPQTTRSEIRGIMNVEDNQIIFTDIPGIHKPNHRLESNMNKQASSVIQGVDVVYLVVDGSVPFSTGDEYVLRMMEQVEVPVFLILNKIDLLEKKKVLQTLTSWQNRFDFAEIFPLSAKADEEFQDLIQATISYLPEGGPLYPIEMVTDSQLDFQIGELIREKVLHFTEQEVPHATAVLVEERRKEDDHIYIRALILVEKQGQKGIIIGKQGRMIQKIRKISEKEISSLLQEPVELELFVRVEESWREKEKLIRMYGYGASNE